MLEKIYTTDFMILDWIQEHLRCGWLDWLMPKITFLGEAGLIWIVLALLFLWMRKRRKCGLKMTVSLVICLVLALLILKNVIARPRPCWINTEMEMLVKVPKDYSFPSGHTLSGIASSLIIFKDDRRIGIPAVILAVVIAFSRLYLYVHFPTDVLAGAVLGILLAIATEKIVESHLPKMPAKLISFINAGDSPEKTAEESPSEPEEKKETAGEEADAAGQETEAEAAAGGEVEAAGEEADAAGQETEKAGEEADAAGQEEMSSEKQQEIS